MWCLSRNVAEKRCMRNCGKALRLVTRRLSATSPYHPRLFCPFSTHVLARPGSGDRIDSRIRLGIPRRYLRASQYPNFQKTTRSTRLKRVAV